MGFKSGDNVYKFTLIKKLGGNFGEVWQAFDNTIQREVALKILEPSYEPVAKLLDEARIGNKFDQKNLLPIHYADVVSLKGKTYTLISQEYYKNGAITGHLNGNHFLPLTQTLKVLQDILFGLEYLHNGGFYHNDIKPGNILVDDQMNYLLADYGISGYSINGTPVAPKNFYRVQSAPETSSGSPLISVHSDIYQVGCTAYRLLNGISNLKNEFHTLGPVKYEEEKLKGKIPNINNYEPFVPSRLKKIINKALNIDPTKRFSSALEMRRQLEKLHFPAYWTVDPTTSKLIGIGQKYHYRFNIQPLPGNLFNFQSTKENISSGTINKIHPFTKNRISENEMIKLKKNFINWVIENGA
jgi:serine/threonine protein kinase